MFVRQQNDLIGTHQYMLIAHTAYNVRSKVEQQMNG